METDRTVVLALLVNGLTILGVALFAFGALPGQHTSPFSDLRIEAASISVPAGPEQ